jgi:uncharacterized SAM-binding protein YcdF (DUF218 family)
MSFALGKLAWWALRPSSLLLMVLMLGLVLRLVGRRASGRVIIGAAIAALASVAVLPAGAWLLAPLEARFPPPTLPASVDGIIVLGGAIDPVRSTDRRQLSLNGSAERLTAFAELARRFPRAKLIFTGGTGSLVDTASREADWLAPLLPTLGLGEGRVLLERESRNTIENAAFSRALAKPAAGEIWVLITSAAHMPRSVGVFRAQSWPVVGYPVDYQTPTRPLAAGLGFDLPQGLILLDAAAYEWLGLAYYYIRGATESLYPRP